ncbi:MAG: single-stranded-DNA-specific exonuclease RecJ [Pseudomonadota bacterium]|nr:single-stranded-DNA-specific exonuclease RecJ [Pseudomonadota bacterium]
MWTSRTGRRWELTPAAPPVIEALRATLGLLPLTARVLAARGHDVGSATAFLMPLEGPLHDPFVLLGLPRAVERIERAVANSEHIRLVTDYDVDGTTSCLILHAALDRRIHAAGSRAVVSYHVPDRFREGYGLSALAVETAAADGVNLLVTADIGVRDHATVSQARAAGLDVIVVDHHLPSGESVPADAYAVVCPPQAGCPYPNKALAACGVSLKLATALLADDPRRDDVLRSLFKLAAIGTVADVVDLSTPENRGIVARGLRALNADRHGPGLAALLEVAGAAPGKLDAGALGFRIGPRINAAGRLKDANAVVRLLRERDPASAKAQAHALDGLNRERQGIQEDLAAAAMARIPDPTPGFVVVWGPEEEGWHRGVVGIVASKVRDRVHRPAAVVAVLGSVATGSIRSVPAVHAVRALDAVADLLVRYGGHAAAAGFTVPAEKLPELATRLAAWVDANAGAEDLVPVEAVDATTSGAAITLALLEELERLEPCGKGNPSARIVVEGAITGIRVVKDRHIFFQIDGADAVWWGGADQRELLSGARAVLGTVGLNEWNGRTNARITVEDVA